ncbi:hypothetical protein HPB47_008741, partial [Ixodes persulcatus]
DGGVFTFGNGTYGQLGHGIKSNEILPRRVSELMGSVITQLACGRTPPVTIAEAIRSKETTEFAARFPSSLFSGCKASNDKSGTYDGGVFTFGNGTYGQLGHGVKSNEILPRRVSELMGSVITQLACGRCHTLVYGPRVGRVYAFGLGGAGQLGQGSLTSTTLPCPVLGPWNDMVHPAESERSPSPQPPHGPPEDSEISWSQCLSDDASCPSGEDTLSAPSAPSQGRATPDEVIEADLAHSEVDAPRPLDFRFHSKDSQVLRLDNDLLEQLPFFPATEQVPQELLSYLETIFGSCACLNASYLKEDGSHFNCSELNPGVDMEAARHGFRCIQDAKHSSIGQVVSTCLEELVKGLTNSPTDIEAMRVLLLLPLCHLFRDPANHLATLTKQNHGHLKLALDILSKLNHVNRDIGSLVSYEHFYIPAVTEKVDVQLDYIQWIQTSRVQRTNKVYFCDYPFVFNAQAKTLILQTDSHIQMQQAMETACQQTFASLILPVVPPSNPYLVLYVGRENIVNDTLNQLADQSAADLKKPLKVQFHGEDAVDAGGEFFLLLLKEILDPKYGMFTEYPESRCIWFNTQSFEEDVMYYLIGIVCGLAIYNFTIIALPFPLVLYKKLLKQKVTLNDLGGLSPTLAKGLQELLSYEGDDLESVFFLNFEVSVEHYGHTTNHELKKGGHHIKVNKENRQEYVDLYVDFLLNSSVQHCFEAFSQGFYKVCSSKVLDLFHAQELMILVVGSENYDWGDLEKNAEYKNGYRPDHPTIRMFWRVFHGLDYEEKKDFCVMFLTGSDRIPILGMSEIKIILQPMKVDDDHLPVAHTCFNLLDLPMYSTEDVMREKLRLAIQNTQGFGLV